MEAFAILSRGGQLQVVKVIGRNIFCIVFALSVVSSGNALHLGSSFSKHIRRFLLYDKNIGIFFYTSITFK